MVGSGFTRVQACGYEIWGLLEMLISSLPCMAMRTHSGFACELLPTRDTEEQVPQLKPLLQSQIYCSRGL